MNGVTIVGGKTFVTLIGPKNKPVFQEIESGAANKMSLVNVSLVDSDSPSNRSTVVLTGNFSGAGTFVFQDGKISYRHTDWDYPSSVTINGKRWNNLREPFDLGFEPVCLTGTLVERDQQRGNRDITQLRTSTDRAELDINNNYTSPAYYRVAISFRKRSSQK